MSSLHSVSKTASKGLTNSGVIEQWADEVCTVALRVPDPLQESVYKWTTAWLDQTLSMLFNFTNNATAKDHSLGSNNSSSYVIWNVQIKRSNNSLISPSEGNPQMTCHLKLLQTSFPPFIPPYCFEVVLFLRKGWVNPFSALWRVNEHHIGRNNYAHWKGKWKIWQFYIDFSNRQKVF